VSYAFVIRTWEALAKEVVSSGKTNGKGVFKRLAHVTQQPPTQKDVIDVELDFRDAHRRRGISIPCLIRIAPEAGEVIKVTGGTVSPTGVLATKTVIWAVAVPALLLVVNV
jgi:hypothetical protein